MPAGKQGGKGGSDLHQHLGPGQAVPAGQRCDDGLHARFPLLRMRPDSSVSSLFSGGRTSQPIRPDPPPGQAPPHSHGDSGVDLSGGSADLHRPAAHSAPQPALSGVCRLPEGVPATFAGALTAATGAKMTSNRRCAPAGRNFIDISGSKTTMSP